MNDERGTKDRIISLRIDDALMRALENRARAKSLTKSKLLRNLLLKELKIVDIFQLNTQMWSKEVMSYIFETLSDEQIKKVAYKSVLVEINSLKALLSKKAYGAFLETISSQTPINDAITYLASFITNKFLSKKHGRAWFLKLAVNNKGNKVMITGKHEMGEPFNLFLKHYYQGMLKTFKHEINVESLGEHNEMTRIQIRVLHERDEVLNIDESLKTFENALKKELE